MFKYSYKFAFTPGIDYDPMQEELFPVMYDRGDWFIFVEDTTSREVAQSYIEEMPEDYVSPELLETTQADMLMIASLRLEAMSIEHYGVTVH